MPQFETGLQWEVEPVHLVMGSDSDVYIVEQTVDLLAKFDVPNIVRVISAHRTPKELDAYCEEVAVREDELVIVAYAGMAAALGGDAAARVPQAVIGVPLLNKNDTMNASTAAQHMIPPGNGLTIVGPDQGVNAGLAALRTLGTSHVEVRRSIQAYQEKNRQGVVKKDERIRELGIKGYIAEQESNK